MPFIHTQAAPAATLTSCPTTTTTESQKTTAPTTNGLPQSRHPTTRITSSTSTRTSLQQTGDEPMQTKIDTSLIEAAQQIAPIVARHSEEAERERRLSRPVLD